MTAQRVPGLCNCVLSYATPLLTLYCLVPVTVVMSSGDERLGWIFIWPLPRMSSRSIDLFKKFMYASASYAYL